MSVSKTLEEDAIAEFRRTGFAMLPGGIDRATLAELRGWVAEIQELPEERGSYWRYYEESRQVPGRRLLNRVEKFCSYHNALDDFCRGPLADLAAKLLGEECTLFKEKIHFKEMGGGGFEAHQDMQAGWDRYADFFVSVLVSIDASNVENGCLEIVPGYHQQGLIGSSWEPLNEEQLANMEFSYVPTQPGDVAFFDCFAPHRSAPNRTKGQRRVLFATYNRASAGDQRDNYFADKFASYPPDCERDPNKEYVFRV